MIAIVAWPRWGGCGRRKFRERKRKKTKTKMFTAGEDHDNVCTLLRLTRPRFLLGVPRWDIFLITLNDKSVPVREDMRFEFRAEAFNVFNHARPPQALLPAPGLIS
jgi:hypothetical protein